jgi:hypothetical protein
VLTSLLDLFLTPAYRDVVPLVRQSGVLSYFGSLVYKLAKSRPEYAEVLDPRFRGRARYFSLKHAVRRRMSPSLQRCYFSLRNAFRSKTAPGA